MKSAEIAAAVGMAERTVRHWLSRGDIPYAGPRKPRSSPLDPYKTYLLERWHQGCRSGAQLERELRAKGYIGSQKAIYRCLASLELFVSSPSARSCASSQPNPLLALSASQATWLFFRKEEDLKAEEQENLRQLRGASPDLETAYQLVKEFLHMIHELTGERLGSRLTRASIRDVSPTEPVANGSLCHAHRGSNLSALHPLILQSRDLLKLRVLHLSPRSLERKNKKKQAQQGDHLETPGVRKKNTNFQHTTEAISKVA